MRLRLAGVWIVASSIVIASALAGPLPPGRQHRLTIEGTNTVTFVPEMNLPEFKVDYQAKVEYIIDARYGKEPRPASTDAEKDQEPEKDDDSTDKPASKPSAKKATAKSRKKAESPASKATGAIDLSLHSTEMILQQNGQPVVEMKVARSKFQGRLQPEMPIVSVDAISAPLRLQEIMKGFDVIAASLLLNDDLKVVNRKYRSEGTHRAVTETILSIHAPLPRNANSWEAPTQLAMGQGQTAKGILRFEKLKPVASSALDQAKDQVKEKEFPQVKVKVSGVLKAEGAIAGQFIKDGTYTVTGEQTFDTKTHDWVESRWTVAVDNKLANPAGLIVAHAKGTMTVQSRALETPALPAQGGSEKSASKP